MDSQGRVYLDANVVLEVIFQRGKEKVARSIIEETQGALCVSALTAHLVTHFGSKVYDFSALKDFLARFSIFPLNASSFDWAFVNVQRNDFEDALQVAVAIQNGCTDFYTFDEKLARDYASVPVLQMHCLS